MPEQRAIPLKMLDGTLRQAAAVGNNAAWNCPCERNTLLVGSLRIARRVTCPDCGVRYTVISDDPAGPPSGRAIGVEQIPEETRSVTCLRREPPEPTKQDNYIRFLDPNRGTRALVFVPAEWFPNGVEERVTLTFSGSKKAVR